MMKVVLLWLWLASVVALPKDGDLVESMPGFDDGWQSNFSMYSGYLDVDLTGSGLFYSSLRIHYELHTCVGGNASCPVAVWHQGGPGGSALYGAWTEMGPFHLMAGGPVTNFAKAWNNVANMLYLESPAGSTIAQGEKATGFSSCSSATGVMRWCSWNDVTQGIAYAYTLRAFYDKFPELRSNDLYLVGESYAGQYIPNIVHYMLANPGIVGKPVKGIAVGNACFGGTESTVLCNGRNAERNDIQMYYGKGLISKHLYDDIVKSCDKMRDLSPLGKIVGDAKCLAQIAKAKEAIGAYNIYNVYDNCNLNPTTIEKESATLSNLDFLRGDAMTTGTNFPTKATVVKATTNEPTGGGGYPWECESDPDLDVYFMREDLLEALHLDFGSGSAFRYDRSGPASVLLYPHIIKNMRVLIYNGDADLCVPYLGNEQWTSSMVDLGVAVETEPWHPWYDQGDEGGNYAPAGYVTVYDVPDKNYTKTAGDDFAFLTIRLAGHMVPQYQPKAALAFFGRFLKGGTF